MVRSGIVREQSVLSVSKIAYRGTPYPAAYSDDADHQFRQADHRFRSMPIALEERRSIGALRVRVFGVEV